MPDLTTEYFWHCVTSENWSTTVPGSTGNTYTVSWNKSGHRNQHSVQYDYSCTCSAYKFGNGKHCKHIQQVKTAGQHCNWMQFRDGSDAVCKNNTHHCPECGDEARSMGWGV